MKLTVSLDRDEDGVWIAECPSIPGVPAPSSWRGVSQGSTKEGALDNIKETIQLCLDVRAK